MKTIYTEKHALHAPAKEFSLGILGDPFEKPDRARVVYGAVKQRNFGAFLEPKEFPHSAFLSVHDAGYVDFLQNGYAQWMAEGYTGDAFASAFNVQHAGARPPQCIDGKFGYYMSGCTFALTKTSWEAIESSAFVALTAQKLISDGEESAFALCRPPGHHATAKCASGYCFLNNAAIATQAFLNDGAKRVAILDVDYHHGDGTQDIFYARDDVMFASLHADPAVDYPYFRGYADEMGQGRGLGFNLNYPLPFGTDYAAYALALQDAVRKIGAYAPDALVVSLGVDTFENDPISRFLLKSADYFKIGAQIASLKKPTLFVLEGGYAVEEIGINVANVLEGFENG